MHWLRDDVVGPLMVFAVPLVAIAGGILASVVRTLSHHRLMEAVIQERMALVARGVDPARLSAASRAAAGLPPLFSLDDFARHRAQGLLVGGFVTLVGGAAFALVVGILDAWDPESWAGGVIAGAIGLALIASGLVVWPRGSERASAPRG